MTTVNDLIAFHEITQLKYRYLRGLDTQEWDVLEACFTEDAHAWYTGGTFTHTGRKQIVDFLRELIPPAFVSSHIAIHPEIRLTSETTAEGIWRLQDIVYFTEANPVFDYARIEGGEEMTGAGYYFEEYRKEGGAWLISSIGYQRIFEVIERPPARTGTELTVGPTRGLRS